MSWACFAGSMLRGCPGQAWGVPVFTVVGFLVDPRCVGLQETSERGWQLGQPSCREGAATEDVGNGRFLLMLCPDVPTC